MAAVSRTFGPLHFEDLEPKRFEDLVRQLVYDFRPWRRLEATGRSGSDDGFDARGYEPVGALPELDDDDDESAVTGADDRLWLVQCKRERIITPKKLARYLDDIKLAEGERLHGIVFTAACDFSKTAHDRFREKCKALGVQEWHLWGKAELEDKLMRPENDGLLFAYFGVSLTIRRRSQRTELRARLAVKRKANRILADKEYYNLLIRSPDATTYPDDDAEPDSKLRPKWVVRQYRGMRYAGLLFCLRRYFAFVSDNGLEWDAAMAFNCAELSRHDDFWAQASHRPHHDALQDIWDAFPEKNRAWYEISGLIRYDDILDVDEIGDEYVKEPHIYASFHPVYGPFAGNLHEITTIEAYAARSLNPHSSNVTRIKVFPEELRMLSGQEKAPTDSTATS